MRQLLRNTKHLQGNAGDEIIRLFSSSRAKVPSLITDKFNEFHRANINFINPDPNFDTARRIGLDLFSNLQDGVKNRDEDSIKLLDTIYHFRHRNIESVFLSNAPAEGMSSTYFLDALLYLSGFKTPKGSDVKRNAIVDPELQGTDLIFPHVDGVYPREEPIDVITVAGFNAPCGNYRTGNISMSDILKELPEKDVEILKKPIFYYKQGKDHGAIAEQDLKPIFYEGKGGSIRPAFSSSSGNSIHGVKLLEKNDVLEKDANAAVRRLNDLLIDFYLNRDLEGFHIRTGVNEKGHKTTDALIVLNCLGFHYRDQNGVPKEKLGSVRIVLSSDFTEIKDPNQLPPKIISPLEGAAVELKSNKNSTTTQNLL